MRRFLAIVVFLALAYYALFTKESTPYLVGSVMGMILTGLVALTGKPEIGSPDRRQIKGKKD